MIIPSRRIGNAVLRVRYRRPACPGTSGGDSGFFPIAIKVRQRPKTVQRKAPMMRADPSFPEQVIEAALIGILPPSARRTGERLPEIGIGMGNLMGHEAHITAYGAILTRSLACSRGL